MNYGPTVSVYAAKWYLVRIPYDRAKTPAFNEWMKSVVPIRCWDVSTKGWIFPDAYVAIVLNEAVNFGLLTRGHADTCIQQVARDALKADVVASGAVNDHYLNLGLQPGAPFSFVCMAWEFWKKHFQQQVGAYGQLLAMEASFMALSQLEMGTGVYAPVAPPVVASPMPVATAPDAPDTLDHIDELIQLSTALPAVPSDVSGFDGGLNFLDTVLAKDDE